MKKLDARRCYELLGLEAGATLAQIREQRGKLAQQWHPDKEADPKRKAALEDKMKDINNAFDFLKAFLSGTPPGPSPTRSRTPADTPAPPPAAKKPWEAEAEERRKKLAEQEAKERREWAARKREWKADLLRTQAEAARRRAQQQAEADRLREWLAQEKRRQEQEGKSADRRNGSPSLREAGDDRPAAPPEPEILTRPRSPRPPARQEAGKSKHIYLNGKCTKCGRSREQITGYHLACL